ncbi:hypothetical protein [Bradyrhizobium ottawaense]|uniref:Uncharacterized protein n=1 Tax=Bradyrhizobium ottawaense TaxID=931866 RepID=A0ABY0QHB6_9BRAD|nr:hypothetical protein [Bradyrhizobium ottawaense]SDK43711.1 hypothetical protein SAMN05444163_8109 [Bradyrhizobium ottawaense]
MTEYRIKVARTTIEEFIVHANNPVHLQEKWPDSIGVADPVESYSDGDELLQFTDEETGHTVVVKS